MIKEFKKIYGKEIYDIIESESGLVGTRIELKKDSKGEGTIEGLWLPNNPDQKRNHDLWHVKWDNGSYGVVQENDIIKL